MLRTGQAVTVCTSQPTSRGLAGQRPSNFPHLCVLQACCFWVHVRHCPTPSPAFQADCWVLQCPLGVLAAHTEPHWDPGGACGSHPASVLWALLSQAWPQAPFLSLADCWLTASLCLPSGPGRSMLSSTPDAHSLLRTWAELLHLL